MMMTEKLKIAHEAALNICLIKLKSDGAEMNPNTLYTLVKSVHTIQTCFKILDETDISAQMAKLDEILAGISEVMNQPSESSAEI
jgi:hypothetical protein